VVVDRIGDELAITLDRPEARNALDATMRDQLWDALAVAAADPALSVRWRGVGPAFCAGGDLDEFGSRSDPARAHLIRLTRSLGRVLHELADRTTVELHGACAGSGIELPAFAGRVRAAPDTAISLPELSLGLIPGAGGTVSLPRRIGRHRTAWLAFTGATIDAATAHQWGLVDELTGSSDQAADRAGHRDGSR
jgi:enoyl-CoA hydratase/carnithine racemase